MIKVKPVAIFFAVAAVLAVAAAPALAEFESNSTATKGTVNTGAMVLNGGGATLECISGSGTWTILSGGVAALKGENEKLGISFAGCLLKSSLLKNVKSIMTFCTLELEQEAGKVFANGAVVDSPCVIEAKTLGTCVITIEAGQRGLEENKLDNINMLDSITATDKDIKLKPNADCLGIKATSEAKLATGILAEGQKWV